MKKIRAKFHSPVEDYWVAYVPYLYFFWRKLSGHSTLERACIAVLNYYRDRGIQ